MKLCELLRMGRDRLEKSDVPDADIDADILWQYLSGMNRMDMIMAREDDVDDDKSEAYMKLIEKRSTRIPLQYITGEQNFMGYDFDTAEDVLIPRMDTETLVETALKLVKDADHNVDVLDMCCGSGCIGVSFGLWNKNSRIVLADVSEAAICLARRNVAKLCAGDDRFEVVRTDLFEQISGKYDLILSNPPYIRSDVIETLMPEVREHEPHLALDGTADGLYFYRIIADKAREYIKDEGYVVFEIGNDQAEDVQYLLVDSGYDDIHVVQDLSGNDRVVYGRYDREDNR